MRNVSIDELFTWRDEFVSKAQEAFGDKACDASPQTLQEIRLRCDKIERDNESYRFFPRGVPLNAVMVHMVEGIPDGVVVPCTCKANG